MQPFLGIQMVSVSAKAKNAAFAQEFVGGLTQGSVK
jgi:maltose-binding protein MalE